MLVKYCMGRLPRLGMIPKECMPTSPKIYLLHDIIRLLEPTLHCLSALRSLLGLNLAPMAGKVL